MGTAITRCCSGVLSRSLALALAHPRLAPALTYSAAFPFYIVMFSGCFFSVHDNVEDAGESVNQGHLALMNTMRSLNSNRRLVLSVSGILLLFMLFFFVFMA